MKKKKGALWVILLISLIAVNLVSFNYYYRYDLTQDKRFSLSATTKDLVRQLPDNILINVFLKGEIPAEFRKLSISSGEFLKLLKDFNPSRIKYQFIDPQEEVIPGKSWSDSLHSLGAAPINLSVQVKTGEENKMVYPFALIQSGEKSSLINLFPNSKRDISVIELNGAESMMEYQFARSIDGLMNPSKPFIAYAVGNGEPMGAETYDLQQLVGNNYKMWFINLKTQKTIPDTMKALIIVKPAIPFAEAEKLKIDQYIMRGGKVLWFIDNLHAEQDSLSYKSQLIAYDRNLNIQDLLFNYGVRVNPDLIMDLQCNFMPFAVGGSTQNPQYEFLHWNYYPLFESHGNHIINKNLGLVAGRYVNSIDTVGSEGIKKTILLQSSANSRIISTPALISPNENRNTAEDALYNKQNIPAAVLLEGKFSSFYKGRIGRAEKDSLSTVGGFQPENKEENKMLVVADGDIVLNDVSVKQGPLPMGMSLYTMGSQYEYQFANRDFLMNSLEYLTNKTNIISTRNKEVVLRLLDHKKVESERTKWQIINILIPILLIIITGIIFYQIRRYRFAS